jgi:hypothetical protein
MSYPSTCQLRIEYIRSKDIATIRIAIGYTATLILLCINEQTKMMDVTSISIVIVRYPDPELLRMFAPATDISGNANEIAIASMLASFIRGIGILITVLFERTNPMMNTTIMPSK